MVYSVQILPLAGDESDRLWLDVTADTPPAAAESARARAGRLGLCARQINVYPAGTGSSLAEPLYRSEEGL